MNAAQFSSALGKVNDKYIMEAITGILRLSSNAGNDVIHEPEQYTTAAWEDVPFIEPFGTLFPTQIMDGYTLENDIALYGERTEGVLQARFCNEQLGDELAATVYAKGHYGEALLNEVICGGAPAECPGTAAVPGFHLKKPTESAAP